MDWLVQNESQILYWNIYKDTNYAWKAGIWNCKWQFQDVNVFWYSLGNPKSRATFKRCNYVYTFLWLFSRPAFYSTVVVSHKNFKNSLEKSTNNEHSSDFATEAFAAIDKIPIFSLKHQIEIFY